jgi:cytochrome c-type biogenesis protein CcmE
MQIDRSSIPTIPTSGGERPGATALNAGRMVYVGLVLVAIGLSAALLLRQADDIVALKYDIRVLIHRQEGLRRARTNLEGRIAAQESLQRIQDLGAAWGFVRPDAAREIELVYTGVESGR